MILINTTFKDCEQAVLKENKKTRNWPIIMASLIESRAFLWICVLTPVLIIFLDEQGLYHWRCPVLMITGFYCPGCGMTRAGKALFQGDFSSSFTYHPFAFIFGTGWLFLLAQLFLPERIRKIIIAKSAFLEGKIPLIPLLFILFLFFGLARLIFQIYD